MGLKKFGPSVNYLSVEQLKDGFVALLNVNRTPPRILKANLKMALSGEPSPFSHILPNHGVDTNYQVIRPVSKEMGN